MRPLIYIANFLLGLHYFLTIYVNSSFLSKYIDGAVVNLLYSAGAILNVGLFLLVPYLLSKINGKKLTLLFVFLDFLTVLGLAFAQGPIKLGLFFVLNQMLAPIILYCLDLYLERNLPDEKSTGWARAIFITSLNAALIVSFIAVSFLVKNDFYSPVYLLSAVSLVPLFAIIALLFTGEIRKSYSSRISNTILFISRDKDVLRIIVSTLLLQLFYAIMVIYLPLLLRTVPLFSWKEIGFIIVVMILPFILFELPLGRIMDRRSGETEVLRIGFLIMAASTIVLALIESQSVLVWAAVLFATRIGASCVEIANESYFFKKVTDRNANIISFFRLAQPLAYIISPLIALPVLYFTGYQNLFAVLGLVTLSGLLVIPKVDTR